MSCSRNGTPVGHHWKCSKATTFCAEWEIECGHETHKHLDTDITKHGPVGIPLRRWTGNKQTHLHTNTHIHTACQRGGNSRVRNTRDRWTSRPVNFFFSLFFFSVSGCCCCGRHLSEVARGDGGVIYFPQSAGNNRVGRPFSC